MMGGVKVEGDGWMMRSRCWGGGMMWRENGGGLGGVKGGGNEEEKERSIGGEGGEIDEVRGMVEVMGEEVGIEVG